MLWLRCPECQIVLEVVDDAPTDRLTCPACGALFRWDPATNVFTLFYDPETEQAEPPSEGASPSPENNVGPEDDSEESHSPEETLASIAAKRQRQADEQSDEQWRPFRRLRNTFLTVALLVLGFGVLICVMDGRLPTIGEVLLWLLLAFSVAFMGAILVTIVIGFVDAVSETAQRLAHGKRDEPDLDEIAGQASAKVIRRPRPSGDSPEAGGEHNPRENANITKTPPSPAVEAPPPATDGPSIGFTLNPFQPAAPDGSSHVAPEPPEGGR
jgi:hypothetical protein